MGKQLRFKFYKRDDTAAVYRFISKEISVRIRRRDEQTMEIKAMNFVFKCECLLS